MCQFENTRGSLSWLAVIPASAKETILEQLHSRITGDIQKLRKPYFKFNRDISGINQDRRRELMSFLWKQKTTTKAVESTFSTV